MEKYEDITEPINTLCDRFGYTCDSAIIVPGRMQENSEGEIWPICFFNIEKVDPATNKFAPHVYFEAVTPYKKVKTPEFRLSCDGIQSVPSEDLQEWITSCSLAGKCVKALNDYMADQYGFVDGGIVSE